MCGMKNRNTSQMENNARDIPGPVVQWLRLHASTAGGVALIHGQELGSHRPSNAAKNKKKKKKRRKGKIANFVFMSHTSSRKSINFNNS